MDLHQQCLYFSKVYSYIGAFIPHLLCGKKERILYWSAEQLPDDGFAIEHDCILLPFLDELHWDPFIRRSDDDCSDIDVDSENPRIDPEQPPVRTRVYCTPQLYHRPAGKQISTKYFVIIDDEANEWSPIACEDEYRLAHWCVKHNLRRAVMKKLFRNPTMATIRNINLSQTLFKRFNEMSYAMGINSWKADTECQNSLADPNYLRDDNCTCFFYRSSVECIELLMQQHALWDHMSYAPAKECNDTEKCIYSGVKSSHWWWNEQVYSLNFFIAKMISIASIAMATVWSSDCPFIQQLRPDKSFTLFGRQEAMASIFESQKPWLDN